MDDVQKLRGNSIINYHQLGLPFRLYECEVLFNRGICQLYLGKIDAGLTDLYFAQKKKMSREHVVVDQAVHDRGKGYSVFSIPPGILYRPPEYKIHGLLHIDEDDFVVSFQDGTYRRRLRNNSFLLTAGPGGRNVSAATNHRQEDPVTQDMDVHHSRHEQDDSEWPQAATTATMIAAQPYRHCKQGHEPASPQSIDSMDDPLPPIYKKPETPPMFTDEYTWKVARHGHTSNSVSIHNSNKNSSKTSMVTPTYATNNPKNRKVDSGCLPSPSYDEDEDPNAMQSMLDTELDRILAALTASQNTPVGAIPKLHNSAAPAAAVADGRAQTPAEREERADASASAAKVKPSLPHQHNNTTLKTAYISKLKLKVHFHDTRALLVPSTITFAELMTRIHEKFDVPLSIPLRLQYKDDEEQRVLMIDQDDLIMARRIHRLRNKSSMGDEKLELWCVA